MSEETKDQATAATADPGAANGEPDVRRAEFQALNPAQGSHGGENIDLVMGVNVSVTIELGGIELPLRDVLNLGPGAVIKLNRPIGDPVDILINHELVGRGEVVVVDDQFGVRVTELVKPSSGRNS